MSDLWDVGGTALHKGSLMNRAFVKLNRNDLFAEKQQPLINNTFVSVELSRAFCVRLAVSGEDPEMLFDLETEWALLDRISFKPFKKRVL